MKKRIITGALAFMLVLTVCQGAVLASFADGDWVQTGQPVNIGYQSNMMNYLTLNGSVRGFRYTYFWFLTKDGVREEHPVYCMAPDMRGAFELVRDDGTTGDGPDTAKYITGDKITRADYITIMEVGYPHNTYSSLGVNSTEEGYYATKIALWMVILGITPGSGGVAVNSSHPDQAAALRVYNAAIYIYNTAQAYMWAGYAEPEVRIPAPTSANSWKLSADGQWYEMTTQVRSNKYIGTDGSQSGEVQLSWDESTGALPAGTVVLNGNDDITATMKPLPDNRKTEGTWRVQPITIRVPAQVVNAYFEDPANREASVFPMPTLRATAVDMSAMNFYVASYSGNGGQPYLIEGDRKADVATAFQTVIPKNNITQVEEFDMGLRIVKLQAGTLIPLAGAVIEVYGPHGQLLGSYATDSNGEIDVPLGEAGIYTVKETIPPQYHILPTHTAQNVQVNVGEVSTVTVTNDPYGALRIEKRDSANGRPLGGASVQIKHIASGVTFTAVTDFSGVAEFASIPIGGYEIRELVSPSGYALDTSVHTVAVRPFTQGVTSYTLPNRANPGLRITKLDRETSSPIEGVVFEIWHDGNLFGEYKTNFAGEILLTNLPAGTYTAREKSTVEPYVLDPTVQWIEITAGQGHISELIFLNSTKPGIYLVKLDASTMQPLVNATYVIKKVGGSFIQEFVTDINGEVNLESLEPGAYTVEEVKAPDGYIIDDSIRTVQINPGENAVFVFTDTKRPSFELVKYDPQNGEYLGGAAFRIARIEDGSHYLDRITDIDGRIRIDDMEPGIYSVQELYAPSGYILNETEYHVQLFPGRTSQIVVENIRKPSLIVWKYDELTARPLPDTEFSIAKMGGQIIYEGVTNSEGFIRLDGLDEGWYTVTEMAPPPGYLPSLSPVKNVYLFGGATIEVKFDNLPCPTLTISKIDRDTLEPLGGVRFNVKFSPAMNFSGGVIDLGEYVTDANGRILLDDNLRSGWYRVTELAPPPGYVPGDPDFKDIFLAGGEDKTLYFENIRKPTLIIWKYDLQTALTLANAEFSISKKDGPVVYEGITDAEGKIVLTDLEPGYYTISEIAPPPGYLLATPASRDVFLEPGKTLEVKFDDLKCPTLTIYKTDSVTGGPIRGVKMNVSYSPNVNFTGGVVNIGDFVTDESGRILLDGDLDAGWYRVAELEAASGYILKEPTAQDVFLAGGEDKTLYFENIPKSALIILKTDLGGRPLQGATFTVKYLAGSSGSGGTLIKTAVTGANGTITITGLAPGTYVVEETIPAPGHQLSNPSVQTAYISDDDQCVVELVFNNPRMGRLVIEKRSSAANHLPVAGVTFRITDSSGAVIGPGNGLYTTDAAGTIVIDEWLPVGSTVVVTEISGPEEYNLDAPPQTVKIQEGATHTLVFYNSPKSGVQIIKTEYGTRQPLKGAHFRVYRANGEAVGDYVTGSDGVIIVPNLEPGWYKAVETRAPDGYRLDDTPKDFHVTGNQFIRLEFENRPMGGIEILKLDEETRLPIPNTEFSITRMNGERLSANTYITDSRGMIRINGLEDGWYTITEEKAAKGYILDPTPHSVEVKNGAAAPLRITNRRESSILLHKICSVTGSGLYGVKFLISDANSNPLMTVETDQNGYVYTTGLTDGKYFIREIEAARGYILDTEIKTFYILYGATAEIEWKNTPMVGQIQITKKSADDNPVNGFPAGTLLEGAVFEIYDRASNLVDTVRSDRNGLAVSKTLPLGRYTIREASAPEFYSATQETIEAEIEFSGQIIRLTVLNKSTFTNVSVTKRGYAEVVPGQALRYDFKNIANNSTVPLDSFFWRDTLPTDAVRLDKVVTGTWSARLSYKIVYKTNLSGGGQRTLADNISTDRSRTIDASPAALGLAANEFVTEVMFVFGRVPAGFRQVEAPYIFCKVLPNLPHEYRFSNKTDVGGLWGSQWVMANDRWVTVVYNNTEPPKLPRTGY